MRNTNAVLRDDARRFEIGNFNYSGVHAMNAALDLILGVGIAAIERHVLDLAEYLTAKLAERGVARQGPSDPRRRSTICAFALPGDGWVEHFAQHGIIVSGRLGSVRISLGLHNTVEEIDRLIAVVDGRLAR